VSITVYEGISHLVLTNSMLNFRRVLADVSLKAQLQFTLGENVISNVEFLVILGVRLTSSGHFINHAQA